jgi:hypothetical protein
MCGVGVLHCQQQHSCAAITCVLCMHISYMCICVCVCICKSACAYGYCRDSLGGNCKTVMVATLSPEAMQTEESMSTCRFAQRVSLIKNKATVNEDVDPAVAIRRLKAEIMSLREEISFLKVSKRVFVRLSVCRSLRHLSIDRSCVYSDLPASACLCFTAYKCIICSM